MKKYEFIECTDEKIEELHKQKLIQGFKLGCSVDDSFSKTICVQQEGRDVALMDYSVDDKNMSINEFEVMLSKRM